MLLDSALAASPLTQQPQATTPTPVHAQLLLSSPSSTTAQLLVSGPPPPAAAPAATATATVAPPTGAYSAHTNGHGHGHVPHAHPHVHSRAPNNNNNNHAPDREVKVVLPNVASDTYFWGFFFFGSTLGRRLNTRRLISIVRLRLRRRHIMLVRRARHLSSRRLVIRPCLCLCLCHRHRRHRHRLAHTHQFTHAGDSVERAR